MWKLKIKTNTKLYGAEHWGIFGAKLRRIEHKSGLSFRIFEKNSRNQKLKEDQNSSDFFEKLKHIFQKLNISEKCWYSYEATVTPQK